jgi:hypothetical protein
MRYFIGAACVLTSLMALPLGAQDVEESTTAEPTAEEPAPSSETAPAGGGLSSGLRKRTRKKWDPQTYDLPASRPSSEEPALQLELDSAGSEFAIVPPSPPAKRGLDPRQRAGIGLGVSVVAFVAGAGMGFAALGGSICISFGEPEPCARPGWVAPVGITGGLLAVGGVIGMAVSGSELRHGKHGRGSSRGTPRGSPGRAQWDQARSRLVF